jgi:hypothetical protein
VLVFGFMNTHIVLLVENHYAFGQTWWSLMWLWMWWRCYLYNNSSIYNGFKNLGITTMLACMEFSQRSTWYLHFQERWIHYAKLSSLDNKIIMQPPNSHPMPHNFFNIWIAQFHRICWTRAMETMTTSKSDVMNYLSITIIKKLRCKMPRFVTPHKWQIPPKPCISFKDVPFVLTWKPKKKG